MNLVCAYSHLKKLPECIPVYYMALTLQNLSSGFLTKGVTSQSPQLQRLARKFNFMCSKFTYDYDTFQKGNNKIADQMGWMRRLVCACVVLKSPKTGFLAWKPI